MDTTRPGRRPGKAAGSEPRDATALPFTREIERFAHFICPATGIGVVYHVPNIIQTTAKAIAEAPGMDAT